MAKNYIKVFFAATLALSLPVLGTASGLDFTAVEQVSGTITVTVSQQTATVIGAQGETLEVVSLTGKKMLAVSIDSPAQRVELNIPKGCYILKVGNVVRKITVK